MRELSVTEQRYQAVLGEPDHPEADGYWEAFRSQSDHVERSHDVFDPRQDGSP